MAQQLEDTIIHHSSDSEEEGQPSKKIKTKSEVVS
jgi:hypothetical protein